MSSNNDTGMHPETPVSPGPVTGWTPASGDATPEGLSAALATAHRGGTASALKSQEAGTALHQTPAITQAEIACRLGQQLLHGLQKTSMCAWIYCCLQGFLLYR